MIKKGLAVAVILLFIGVALAPSVNAKMNNEPVPDLDCEGFLAWSGEDLEPGDVLTGSFTVENIGEPNSELDWRIMSCPFWGTWTFDPESGTGLTPEDGFVTIDVEFILEVEINETLYGEIGIQNVDNESDICYIDIQIKKKSVDDELVEFDVEFCGLERKHTLQLTQQEVDEVNLLFVELQKKLEATESKEERNTIITQAVIELDNYGLLGSVNIEQAQKLVLGEYANDIAIPPFEKVSHENSIQENQYNFFCFVSGIVYDGYATGQLGMIGVILALLGVFGILDVLRVIGVLLMVISEIIVTVFPLSIMQSITIFSANIISLGILG